MKKILLISTLFLTSSLWAEAQVKEINLICTAIDKDALEQYRSIALTESYWKENDKTKYKAIWDSWEADFVGLVGNKLVSKRCYDDECSNTMLHSLDKVTLVYERNYKSLSFFYKCREASESLFRKQN